jgi:hypothetical protein
MTVMNDLNAVSLTGTAAAFAETKGCDLAGVVNSAKVHVRELRTLLQVILSCHPNSGGDTANYAALQAVVAELA